MPFAVFYVGYFCVFTKEQHCVLPEATAGRTGKTIILLNGYST
jgi:hypothetical protein